MDNFAGRVGGSDTSWWEPRTTGIVGCALAGLLLAAAGLTDLNAAADPLARVLAGIGAAGLLAFAAVSWRARPRLAVKNRTGADRTDAVVLVVRGWWRTRVLHRTDVAAVRITEFRRLARTVRLLEIETGDGDLTALSRWELGCNPIEVLDALVAAGFGTRPAGG